MKNKNAGVPLSPASAGLECLFQTRSWGLRPRLYAAACFGACRKNKLCAPSAILSVSAASLFAREFTAEAQRSPRLRRENRFFRQIPSQADALVSIIHFL